ncbi:PhoU/TrkA-C domain protein [Halalkaliarchaeum desulfuricum]|uniref:PhoU/TrkA-C domain protein n=1 Tax=Halalkaliarchaeum desulfuricum TaxID=2055893 RepID=A0A343TKH3_9EURY|nr:potassium channel family protein [Halalkaliarchaeum desulfuricum]AUX09595.1 PhoU/TrkA-C domain protein [Halalkaliarchaeum desulfuricum]
MNLFGDRNPTEPVEYEPTSVKELLVEMKDTSELLIDLAYSAVLHQSENVAREVLELEHRMDVLQMRARMSLILAARNPSEAEQLAPVLGIVAGADKVSDAAGDIAKIVLEDIGLPDAMRGALSEAVEVLVRGTIAPDSSYAGRTLLDINLESETGVRVIAIRRDDDWILNPGPETVLEGGDVTILRGPDPNIEEVYERATGEAYEVEPPVESDIDDLERAVDSIVLMKNLSELAVDLAYGSVLFDNEELAEEVSNLEVEVDSLQSRFEAWTLQAAKNAEDPVALRGLIHLGVATEEVSDAALEITEGVLRDLDVHPVVELAVRESDEIITRTTIVAGSDLDGTAVTDGVPDTDISTSVIAIRRPEEGWIVGPDLNTAFRQGDVVITKGTRTSATEFAELAG